MEDVKTVTIRNTCRVPVQTEAVQTDTAPKVFEIPTEAQDLVGEGKKYKICRRCSYVLFLMHNSILRLLSLNLLLLKEELTKTSKQQQELLDEIKSGIQPAC